MRELLIKAEHGGRINVKKSELLEIVNVRGQQICDFFAFNAEDLAEPLSPAQCRVCNRQTVPKVGGRLFSSYRRPILEIVEHTCCVHDMLIPPCDPHVYVQRFGLHNHRSCRTNLMEAMADFGLKNSELPDPVNFFQNTPVLPDGTIEFRLSVAK